MRERSQLKGAAILIFDVLYGFLSVKNQTNCVRKSRINDGVIYKKIYAFKSKTKIQKTHVIRAFLLFFVEFLSKIIR